MYVLISEDALRDSDMHKYCTSVIIFFLFILFQLHCCLRICEMMFKMNNEIIKWWLESFFSSEFIIQWITCYINHRNVKTRFIIITDLWFSHIIISDNISSYNFVSLTIFIRSSVMQYLIKHLISSHQRWCRLKLSRIRYLSDLSSNYISM